MTLPRSSHSPPLGQSVAIAKALMIIRAARAGAEVTHQYGTIQLLDELEAALTEAPSRGQRAS